MLDVVKTVRPIVEDLGDDEGAFPRRSKLVWFVLIHSENQIPFLEGSTSHISGVETAQILLVNRGASCGYITLFVQQVKSILARLFIVRLNISRHSR